MKGLHKVLSTIQLTLIICKAITRIPMAKWAVFFGCIVVNNQG